jgi:hypothetical protein
MARLRRPRSPAALASDDPAILRTAVQVDG